MNGVQFPTDEGLEAGRWCPTGTGLGHHVHISQAGLAEAKEARAKAMAACMEICLGNKYHDKMLKAVIKEGGKKGIEIGGAADMGGLEFFNTQVEQCKGKIDLTELCMHAMNKDIDPEEEESKGGSFEVGKMLSSAGDKDLAIVAYVPDDKTSKINATEWLKHVVSELGFSASSIITSTDTWATAVLVADADKGQFTLKMKEVCLQQGINFLRLKGAFPEDDGDEEEDECYANEFEW